MNFSDALILFSRQVDREDGRAISGTLSLDGMERHYRLVLYHVCENVVCMSCLHLNEEGFPNQFFPRVHKSKKVLF